MIMFNSLKEKIVDYIAIKSIKKVYISRKDIKDFVDKFFVSITVCVLFFALAGGLYYFNETRAKITIKYEMELKLVDLDIKRDNSMRLYYDDKVAEGYTLTEADKKHLKRINERLERNYQRVVILKHNIKNLE